MKIITSPLRYPGGKSKALKKIIPYTPMDFSEYREPFVGGGSIFLRLKQLKPNAKYKINDLNFDLMCFWKQLQQNPDELIKEIRKIKDREDNGRNLFNRLKNDKDKSNEFSVAVRYFVLNRIAYSGLVDTGGYSQESFEGRFTYSAIKKLVGVSKLLDKVEITKDGYEKLLLQDGKDVFIFLDPPYYGNKKSRLYGKLGKLHRFFNHQKFAEDVKNCEHNYLITYDDSNEIRKLFSFSNIYPWKLQYLMDNVNGNKPKKGSEIFITNYEQFKFAPVNKKLDTGKYDDIIKQVLNIDSNIIKIYVEKKNPHYVRRILNNRLKKNKLFNQLTINVINNEIYVEKNIHKIPVQVCNSRARVGGATGSTDFFHYPYYCAFVGLRTTKVRVLSSQEP